MAGLLREEPHYECGKSELDYTSVKYVQGDIESDYWQHLSPKNTLASGNPLLFEIESTSDFVDLSQTTISIKYRVKESDGTVLDGTSKAAPINNTLHSLFSQVTISLKDHNISQPNSAYPYRAYLETLLNYSKGAKKTWLQGSGWSMDDAGKLDAEINTALAKRRKPLEGNAVAELKGRLHSDIFFQPRLIPNGLDIRITLTQSKPEFSIQSFDAGRKYSVDIEEATLNVRKVKLSPQKQIAFEKAISTTPARLPITYCTMKSCSIAAGLTSYNQDGLFTGVLPSLIVLGLVSNEAYSGSYATNPFNFKHYDLQSLVLNVDGRSVPTRPLSPDFSKDHVLDCYDTLWQALGTQFDNWANDITLNAYTKGCTLYAFNLTPDNCPHNNSTKTGSVDLSMRFGTALPETVSLVCYASYENSIQIDMHRNVITDIST